MDYQFIQPSSPNTRYAVTPPVPGSVGYSMLSQQYQSPDGGHSMQNPSRRPNPPVHHPPNYPMVMIPQRSPHLIQQYQQYVPYPPQHRPAATQTSRPKSDPTHRQSHPQVAPQKRSHTQAMYPPTPISSIPEPLKATKAPQSDALPPELLLSLADEYITAAHAMGPTVALSQRQEELQQYYKLIATGLGCMEAVLKRYRLHPRVEATIRLRYASSLYQETENNVEMEAALSKGAALCERNKFLDLKYSMQHLLARVLFKSSPRAALKSLDSLIPDVEAYQHVAWVYAFRLLRVSLSLQMVPQPEFSQALQHLRHTSALAESHGDRSVFVMCTTLEAMVHLRSSSNDSIEQAQRAIASARSLQLQVSSKELAQVEALLDCIDLACSLQQYKPEEAVVKMQKMQVVMDEAGQDASWKDDGSFAVLIDRSSGGQSTATTGGIFQKSADGRDMLTFVWLQRRDLYMLGYYLSGVTAFLKNSIDAKAEKYLREGVKATQGSLTVPDVAQGSLSAVASRTKWQTLMNWHMRLHLIFSACNHAGWAGAKAALDDLKSSLNRSALDVPETLERLTTYVAGIIDQGSGNLNAALSTFQSSTFALPTSSRTSDARADLSILAALNSLLILRDPSHPHHNMAADVLTTIEPLCLSHPSKSIQSSFYLVKATSKQKDSIVKTKQYLQMALHAAKATVNTQLLCVSMNFMTAMFFTNIVGEQAEKSARAGRLLAKRADNRLWTCVADGMLANTLEKHGKVDEAEAVRREAEELMVGLPGGLRERCGGVRE